MKTIIAYIGWGLAIILLSSLLIGHSGILPGSEIPYKR